MDDEDDEEEGEDDPDADDEDEEEEEDLLTNLDNDEREELINNTEAVRTMLNKVRLMFYYFFCLCTHVHCCYRFANSPSLLSIPPPLSFPHGVMPVLLVLFACDLSLAMSKLDGILHMIC